MIGQLYASASVVGLAKVEAFISETDNIRCN